MPQIHEDPDSTTPMYLLSSTIPNFVDGVQATIVLAYALLAYLGVAGMLDCDEDGYEINENILDDTYRRFEHTYISWPHMLYKVQPTPDNATSLGNLLLVIMQDAGANAEFPFTHSHRFSRRLTTSFYTGESWDYEDPLATSEMLVWIQERHEALTAEVTHRSRLILHCGINLLK